MAGLVAWERGSGESGRERIGVGGDERQREEEAVTYDIG
jgi:hypothetical protein